MFRRNNEYIQPKGMNILVLLGYLIFGAYFINVPFNFLPIPEIITRYNQWITLVGGIFILFGALHYFKSKRRF